MSHPTPITAQDTFSVYEILGSSARALLRADPALETQLSLPLPKLPQLLEALRPALDSSTVARNLEVFVPHKVSAKGRERLRQAALDIQNVLQAQDTNATSSQAGLPIHTPMTLNSADVPKALTAEQRKSLRERSKDILYENLADPYFLVTVSVESQRLPTVKCNLRVTPVEFDDGMPIKSLDGVDCLWDTGCQITIITEDVLGANFCEFLHNDEINEPYRSVQEVVEIKPMADDKEKSGGKTKEDDKKEDGKKKTIVKTKVQVSCVVEMSNKKIQVDCIALVVPLEAVPNRRSGVIIGQKLVIDHMQYMSIPRAVLAAHGKQLGEEFWGHFDVVSYFDVFGDLVHV